MGPCVAWFEWGVSGCCGEGPEAGDVGGVAWQSSGGKPPPTRPPPTLISLSPLSPQMARPIQVKPADSESRGGSCHLSAAAGPGVGRGRGKEGYPCAKACSGHRPARAPRGAGTGEKGSGVLPPQPQSPRPGPAASPGARNASPLSGCRSGVSRPRGDGVPKGLRIDFRRVHVSASGPVHPRVCM